MKQAYTVRKMKIGDRLHVDTMCARCVAIVPVPEQGCSRCHRKAAQAKVRIAAMKERFNGA